MAKDISLNSPEFRQTALVKAVLLDKELTKAVALRIIKDYPHHPALTQGADEGLTGHDLYSSLIMWQSYYLPSYLKALDYEPNDFVTKLTDSLDAVAGVYRITDIALSQQDVTCQFVHDQSKAQPSWTDGKTVFLNTPAINDVNDIESLMSLHALNLHEVGHILFSPRTGSDLVRYCLANNYGIALNILDDQRQETMLVTKYSNAADFLTLSFYDYVMAQGQTDQLFIGARGRKYLPIDLRQRLADEFIKTYGSALAQQVAAIVDEFITLVLPPDTDRAKELVRQFAELLNIKGNGENGNGNSPQGGGSNGESDDQQSDQQGQGGGESDDQQGQPSDQQSQGNGGSTDQQGNEQSDQQGTGAGGYRDRCSERKSMRQGRMESVRNQRRYSEQINNAASEDLSEQSEQSEQSDQQGQQSQPSDQQGQQSERQGAGVGGKNERERLAERLSNSRDIQRVLSILRSRSGDTQTHLRQARAEDNVTSQELRMTARKFSRELSKVVEDCDPMWHRDNPSGRLNVARAMRGDVNMLNTVFDRWDAGNPDTDIEAVLLIDASSSMAADIDDTCQAAWVIQRGVQDIRGSLTTMTFDDESKVLVRSGERVSPTHYKYYRSRGSTYPTHALEQTKRIMESSNRPNKIVFILTDGAWGDSDYCDALIASMKQDGVMVVCSFLSPRQGWVWNSETNKYIKPNNNMTAELLANYRKHYGHGADVFRVLTNPDSLVLLAGDIVKATLGGKRG